jgi:hypothetical protein
MSLLHDVLRQAMGEWKVQLGLRVRQALRLELEEFATREKRKLGNVGEIILEWGFEQLKAAGSIDRLLKYKIRPRSTRSTKEQQPPGNQPDSGVE